MIRPLRNLHRRSFVLLALTLPMALGLSIAVRKPVPVMQAMPAGLTPPPLTNAALLWQRGDLFAHLPIRVQLLRTEGGYVIRCSAEAEFTKPDLLCYWCSGSTAISDTLPGDATLLGAFHSQALTLPMQSQDCGGKLVLFSLADKKVIAASETLRLNDSMQ